MKTSQVKETFDHLVQNGLDFNNIVFPAIGNMVAALAKVGAQKDAVKGIADAIKGIADGLTNFINEIGKYIPQLNGFWKAAGKLFKAAGKPLADLVVIVAEVLTPTLKGLKPILQTIGDLLKPVADFLATKEGQPVANILGAIALAFIAWNAPMVGIAAGIGAVTKFLNFMLGEEGVVATISGIATGIKAWAAGQSLLDIALIPFEAVIAVIGSPIFLIGLGIAALALAVYELATHWKEDWKAIQDASSAAWKWIDSNLVQPLEDFFTKTVPSWGPAIGNFFTQTIPNAVNQGATAAWNWLNNNLGKPVQNLVDSVMPSDWGTKFNNFMTQTVPNAFQKGGTAAWNFLNTNLGQPLQNFVDTTLKTHGTNISNFITQTVPNAFQKGGTDAWNFLNSNLGQPLQSWVETTLPQWGTNINNWWNTAGGYFNTGATTAWNFLNSNLGQPVQNFVTSTLPSWGTSIGNWATVTVPNAISSGMTTAWNFVVSQFANPFGNFVTQTFSGWGTDISNFFTVTVPNSVSQGMTTALNWFNSQFVTPVESFFTTTLSNWGTKAENFFKVTIPNAVSAGMTDVQNAFKTAVDWLIDYPWNYAIVGIWNAVINAVGLPGSWQLPEFTPLAGGGRIPGYGGGDKHLALLEGGEAVVSKETTAANAGTLAAMGVPGFQAGGAAPGPGGGLAPGQLVPLGSAWNPAFSGLSASGQQAAAPPAAPPKVAINWAQLAADPGAYMTALMNNQVKGMLRTDLPTGSIGPGVIAAPPLTGKPGTSVEQGGNLNKVVKAIPQSLIVNLGKGFASKAVGSIFGGSGTVNTSGSVASWLTAAMKLTGVPSSWLTDLETIAYYESGDNPMATNTTDSNAAAGDPSRGLMQTIMSTFNAYHVAGTSTNIFDPVANAAAAIKYIQARYGSVANVPGIRSIAAGGSYMGYDSGGWLQPGGLNATGKPEAVLSPEESQAFVAIAKQITQQGGGGLQQPVVVNITGTQWPNVEQIAYIKRELALAVSGG